MVECGFEWNGRSNHRCVRPFGHGGLAHQCHCGAQAEFHHDDDEDQTVRQDGGW